MFAPDFLAGQTILVTGASSGLGRDFAIEASRYGATIVAFGRDEGRLASVIDVLHGSGHSAEVFEIEKIDHFKIKIRQLTDAAGPLTAVFHSAGENRVESIRQSDDTTFDRLFDPSLRGAVAIASACMRKSVMVDGGRIVLMSSASATKGVPGLALYGASKAAVAQFVKIAASELARRKIGINAIAAGNVRTEMHAKFVDQMLDSQKIESQYPLGFGDPTDVTATALFLMSPAARWITGTNMLVDGGFAAL